MGNHPLLIRSGHRVDEIRSGKLGNPLHTKSLPIADSGKAGIGNRCLNIEQVKNKTPDGKPSGVNVSKLGR